MNTLESRERDLDRRYDDLKRRSKTLTNANKKQFVADAERWLEDNAAVERERKAFNLRQTAFAKIDGSALETKAVTSKVVSPLRVPVAEYKGLYEAVTRKLPSYRIDCNHFDVSTKAAFSESSFASGNLPPELMPGLSLDLPYEPDRAFELFKQMTAPPARAVEYIQHTGNTNPAAVVAELGVKPDLGMQLTTVTTPFVKIAALASVSMEALQDFAAFTTWVPHEIQRALIEAETNWVINGSGTGLLNVSGVLTRSMGTDTPIDALRKAINDVRIRHQLRESGPDPHPSNDLGRSAIAEIHDRSIPAKSG